MSKERSEVIAEVRRVTFAGMLVNGVIAVAKGLAGVLWSSQALIADAVHSVSDLATDIAVIFGVKYWEAPADDEHPYGHGKIQALITMFIGIMLALVAYELVKHAIVSLASKERGTPGIIALVVAVVSIVGKEWLFQWTRAVARKIKSPALEANAWHHRSDAFSSIPVAIAVMLAYFFPSLWWVDGVGAMVVALFIVHVVWEIVRPALQELTDAGIDDKSEAVKKVAEGVDGVMEVHQCRARRYGGAFQADLHVMVDKRLSIVEAHDIGHKVKDTIIEAGIDVSDVIIHIEPKD